MPKICVAHLCIRPTQTEGGFMSKEFAETQHQAVDEWKQQVDGCPSENAPNRGRLVEDHWRAGTRRRRGGHLIVRRIVFRIGGDGHGRVVELDSRAGSVGGHEKQWFKLEKAQSVNSSSDGPGRCAGD